MLIAITLIAEALSGSLSWSMTLTPALIRRSLDADLHHAHLDHNFESATQFPLWDSRSSIQDSIFSSSRSLAMGLTGSVGVVMADWRIDLWGVGAGTRRLQWERGPDYASSCRTQDVVAARAGRTFGAVTLNAGPAIQHIRLSTIASVNQAYCHDSQNDIDSWLRPALSAGVDLRLLERSRIQVLLHADAFGGTPITHSPLLGDGEEHPLGTWATLLGVGLAYQHPQAAAEN